VKNLLTYCRADLLRDTVNRIEWIEETAQPFIGCIRSRSSFIAHAYETLGKDLPYGTRLEVENVRVASDYAVVTLRIGRSVTGEPELNQRYRWICRFVGAPIRGWTT
jgi:hypothetical protein